MSEWLIAHDTFALFVFAKRKNDGMSVREAADDAGLSASAVTRAENRQTISAPTFLAFCLWMKANPYWFLIDPKTGKRLVEPPDVLVPKKEGVKA